MVGLHESAVGRTDWSCPPILDYRKTAPKPFFRRLPPILPRDEPKPVSRPLQPFGGFIWNKVAARDGNAHPALRQNTGQTRSSLPGSPRDACGKASAIFPGTLERLPGNQPRWPSTFVQGPQSSVRIRSPPRPQTPGGTGYTHLASGGKLIRTAFASWPVSSPNLVPRS